MPAGAVVPRRPAARGVPRSGWRLELVSAPAQVRYVQLNATLPPRTKDGKAVSKPVTAAVARDEAFGGETVLVILY